MRLLAKTLCLIAFAATTLIAKADELDGFTFTYDGNTVTWMLPSSLTTDSPTPHFFVVDDVPVYLNGVLESANIEFASSLIGGGLSIDINDENPYFAASGPQVWTSSAIPPAFPTTAPTFLTGQYTLEEDGQAASLVITPEPSTFLLLGSGILGLAAAARRRLSLSAPQKAS